MSEKNIVLSDFERVSLVNQFLIMKGQGKEVIDEVSFYDFDKIDALIEILRVGHEGLYDEVFDIISKPISKSVVDEVYGILSLYDDALSSFEKLSDAERTEELRLLIKFDGFDGRDEKEHYSTLKTIVKHLEQFEGLFEGNKDLNSHMNRLSKYRKQLDISKGFEGLYELSSEDLYKIFGKQNLVRG